MRNSSRVAGGSVSASRFPLPRLEQWALILLMLLAFGRGIWALGAKSLWWDESLSLHRAQQDLASIVRGRIVLTDNVTSLTTIDDHPPLYFLLLSVAVHLWGRSEFALRFPSLAAMVAIVPLLYVTGRRVVDRRAGLAAAALGALSPMYLWYGQEARMYTLVTFWGLLSYYALERTFQLPEGTGRSRQHAIWIGVFAFACVCMVLTHYLGVLLVAYELALLAFHFLRRRDRSWVRTALVLGIVALVAAALTSLMFMLPNGISAGGAKPGFRFIRLRTLLRDLLNSFSLGLSVDAGRWYILLIDLAFLALVLLGFARLVRRSSSRAAPAAGWRLTGFLILPVALIYVFSYVQPAYMNSRHLMFITPAFYLMVAAGLTWPRGRLRLVAALVSIVMAAGVGFSTRNYFYDPYYDKAHHREWGEYLRDHVRPGDVVVVDPPHVAELYEYYGGSDVPWIGLPLLGEPEEETAARLSELLTRYDRIWLAISSTPDWGDPEHFPEGWLNENAYRIDYHPFESSTSNLLAALYLPSLPVVQHLPQDAQAAEILYSTSLRLLGYRSVSPATPGRLAHVELYWAVDQSIRQEASVLLRLVDGEGHVWGQGEQCPFNGLYPMWQWPAGQIVAGEQEFRVDPGTPPGDYQLELMLVSRPGADGCLGSPGQPIRATDVAPGADRGDRTLLGSMSIQASAVAPRLSDLGMERRLAARVEGLELLGASVPAAKVEPGGRLSVALFWQANRSGLSDLQFRLSLVDQAGRTWSEQTIRPAGDSFPTQDWHAGNRLKGQFWLLVPDNAPNGRYSVELEPVSPPSWAVPGGLFVLGRGALRVDSVAVMAHQDGLPGAGAAAIPIPTGLPISHPMIATLGGVVRFLGYDLDRAVLEPGEPLSFTLYWQALAETDRSYTVFTHLLGPENRVIGQQDNQPRRGTYPTTLWQPGRVITDTYALTLAPDVPPGNYPLEVGMYVLETGKRLAIADEHGLPVADDRLVLAFVELMPSPTPEVPGAYRIYLPLIQAAP